MMSAAKALKELTCSERLGGGSVLRLPEVSELIGHLEEGRCSEELLEAMAAIPRGPTPDEWAAMRAGESVDVPEVAPEPDPVEEVPNVESEEVTGETGETPTEEPAAPTNEAGDTPDPEPAPV